MTDLLLSIPKPAPITDSWLQWIAENRLRGCTPESMAQTMAHSGIDYGHALRAIASAEAHPFYLAAMRHQQLQRKLQSIMHNIHQLQHPRHPSVEIEHRDIATLPEEEFLKRYYYGNRPVVLSGIGREWPAFTQWTPAALRDRFASIPVEVQLGRAGDPKFEEHKAQYVHTESFGVFAQRVLDVSSSNDFYLTANNELLKRPEFASMFDDIGALPYMLDPEHLRTQSGLWFGPAGTVTPLHHDAVHLLNLQIVGRKRWRMISPLQTPLLYNFNGFFSPIDLDEPDLSRYPDFAQAVIYDTVVEPGEAMFLPLAWWHHVASLDVCISLSLSNLRYPNRFTFENPELADWV